MEDEMKKHYIARLICYIIWAEIRRPFHMIGLYFYEKILTIIEYLQKTNKRFQNFLSDAHIQMNAKALIYKIKQRYWIKYERLGGIYINPLNEKQLYWIEYDRLNKIYTDFVKRKRQSILEEINRIENQFMEYRRERDRAGLPNEGMPAETTIKHTVLQNCYVYLEHDNLYHQKAFKLFLKKKMEEMEENNEYDDEYDSIETYLEDSFKNENYEDYITYWYEPVDIRLSELWIEFFRGCITEYMDILPKKWPNVAYSHIETDVPNFIFEEQPYVHEYTEEEFRERFMKEWNATHYNPYDDNDHDDEDFDAMVDYADYYAELADKPHYAFNHYQAAVFMFRGIQKRLNADAGTDKGGVI